MNIFVLLVSLAFAVEGADVGEFCTKEGAAGVCINIRVCPTALEDIKNRKAPQNCRFGSIDPIVCCVPPEDNPTTTKKPALTTTKRPVETTTTENVPPTYDYVNDKDGDGCQLIPLSLTTKPNGQKAWDKCLEYQERLVLPCDKSQPVSGGFRRSNRCHHNADELTFGSETAAPNEFPHMALLGYGDDPASLQWLCGGSLISEKFVLTAGHCISNRDGVNVTYVQLGTLRRSSLPARDLYRVKRIIPHPQYTPPHRYHDIALLELERPVPLDEFLVPACIHTGAPANYSRASAAGWGVTAHKGQPSDTLKKVLLTKVEALECETTYKPSRRMKNGLDDTTQICFRDRAILGALICQGDSGGPLQINNKQIACMHTIVGVTSFGVTCGLGSPGIYTRVAYYRPWIEEIVWP